MANVRNIKIVIKISVLIRKIKNKASKSIAIIPIIIMVNKAQQAVVNYAN